MRTDGRNARGQFNLTMGEGGETTQRWYQIRFAESETGEGRENLDPVRHRIEVFGDLAPKVRLIDAPADNATVPLDGMAELKIEASDPDFALSRVAFLAERDGRPLAIPLLLDRTDRDRGYEGQFQATYRFEPAKLGLQVGDEVEYRAVAEDNRQPERNRSETEARWLKIGPPEDREPGQSGGSSQNNESQGRQQEQPGEESQNQPGAASETDEPEMGSEQAESSETGEEDNEGAPSDDKQSGEAGEESSDEASGKSGEEGSSEEGKSQQDAEGKEGGEPSEEGSAGEQKREEPVDGETNAGDVFDEVLKQMEKDKEKEQQPGGNQSEGGGEQSESGKTGRAGVETGAGIQTGRGRAGGRTRSGLAVGRGEGTSGRFGRGAKPHGAGRG